MNIYLPNKRLPSTYQEVEYIQSSGTQYIDTGIKLNYLTSVDIDIAFTANRSGWTGIIGAQTYNNNHSFAIGINNSGTATYQNRLASGYRFVDFPFNPTLNQKYGISANGRNIYIDGVLKGTFSDNIESYTTEYNARIFDVYQSYNGGFPYKVSARLYSCKIYDNGTLVRDFVPCYRKSDSVIGMYDLVNNQFYTNSGTGTFSKGNDVTMAELKNAYIGEYREWTPNANTVAYYPFKSDLNNYQGSSAWSVTRGSTTYSDNMVRVDTIRHSGNLFTGTGDFTVLAYMNFINTGFTLNLWSDDSYWYPRFRVSNSFFGIWSPSNSGTWYRIDFTAVDTNNHLMVFVRKNNSIYGYIDGVSVGSNTTVPSINVTGGLGCYIGGFYNNNSDGKIGNLIIENRAWTDDEILKFYNRSKANYGL